MIIRAKSPLRIGLAGGGTDVSPYSDTYGGAILNAAISMYAYATLEPTSDGKITVRSIDRNMELSFESKKIIPVNHDLSLSAAIYNRIVRDFALEPQGFRLTTWVDALLGSGLGSSSTLVVSIIGAFAEWLQLPLGEYEIAHLACEIERQDLKMAGGKQDQYAATFGGFNFMEFKRDDQVIVNPLRIKSTYLRELEFNLLLYYTGTSRISSKIIEEQSRNVVERHEKSITAMHEVKKHAVLIKEALLKGNLDDVGHLLDKSWQYKKEMALSISNPAIDEIYETAKKAGATGGKLSGAGGGGFMIIYCPGNTRYEVIDALLKLGGDFRRFHFEKHGLTTWKIQ